MHVPLARQLSLALVVCATACSSTPSAPASNSLESFVLRGVVREQVLWATLGDPVPGATVSIAYAGEAASPMAATDANGAYRVPGLRTGRAVQVTVTKGGYEPAVRDFIPISSDVVADFGLVPIRITVTGTITEAGGTGIPIPGAVVEVLTGWNKGQTSVSNASGVFTLSGVWSEFSVSVSHVNYQTRIVHVESAVNPRVDVALPPLDRLGRMTFAGDLCTSVKIPPYLSCSAPKERSHVIDVRRPGTMIVFAEYRYVGDYYPNYLSLELRCGSELIRPAWVVNPTHSPAVSVSLTRACLYDVRLFNFIADTKGGVQTTYRLVVDYPQ